MSYTLNADSIIFLDIDESINNHTTIVYDWKNDELVKINEKVYVLLRHIWEKGTIDERELENYLIKDFMIYNQLRAIIKEFLSREIILEVHE